MSAALRSAAGKALGDVEDGGEGNNRFAGKRQRPGDETEGRKLTGESRFNPHPPNICSSSGFDRESKRMKMKNSVQSKSSLYVVGTEVGVSIFYFLLFSETGGFVVEILKLMKNLRKMYLIYPPLS